MKLLKANGWISTDYGAGEETDIQTGYKEVTINLSYIVSYIPGESPDGTEIVLAIIGDTAYMLDMTMEEMDHIMSQCFEGSLIKSKQFKLAEEIDFNNH